MKIVTVIIAVNVALALGFLAGYLWQQQELERLRRDGERAQRPAASAGTERVASTRGIVRDIDRDRRAVLITHEALDGIMGAMTMRSRASEPGLLEGLGVGDRVQFTVQTRQGDLLLLALRKDAS